MKKSKIWYGFYAATLIIVIALFIIFFPIFNKNDKSPANNPSQIEDSQKGPNNSDGSGGGSDSNEDDNTGGQNDDDGDTNTDDETDENIIFKFNINKIEMQETGKLIFGKEIAEINKMEFKDVTFNVFLDDELIENVLFETDDLEYSFNPTETGEYTLLATHEEDILSSLQIVVDTGGGMRSLCKLGDTIDLASLHKDESLTRVDEGLKPCSNGYFCGQAGALNYYTLSNKTAYCIENEYSILVLPSFSLLDPTGESFFVDENFHALHTINIQKTLVFELSIYQRMHTYDTFGNAPEPEDLTYEIKKDGISFVESVHPNLYFKLDDMNINSALIRFIINFYGIKLTVDVQINFV